MNVEQIRTHYPGLQAGIYLNTGGVGQPSRQVQAAIEAGYHKLYDDHMPPIDWYVAMVQEAEAVRQKIAVFLGAGDDEMALTLSTADGYASVLGGLRWQTGDEVVITSEEHPMPYDAVQGLAQREGVVVKVVDLDPDPNVVLSRVEQALNPRTRMICFSHVTTDTGYRLPAQAICTLARQRGILTLWDGCQAVGQFPLNLNDMGCDFYAANCYKWLLGPIGTGFLYVRQEALQILKPLLRPHDPQGNASQYKMGNPSNALYLGLGASLDFITSLGGPQAIDAEVGRKADALRARFAAISGVQFLGPQRPETQTGVVSFAIAGMDGDQISSALKTRWNMTQRATYITRPSGVRISVAFYTSQAELDTLVKAVTILASQAGHG
jgi:selenocysteine lyase/cysteine desulfurase